MYFVRLKLCVSLTSFVGKVLEGEGRDEPRAMREKNAPNQSIDRKI